MQAPTVFRDGLPQGQVVLVSGGGGGIGRAICYLVGRGAPPSWRAGATR